MTTRTAGSKQRSVSRRCLRVAYVTADPGVHVYGRKGNSVHVQGMLRALLDRGAHIDLFAANTGGGAPAGFEAVKIHLLPHATKGGVAEREFALFRANAALRAALERNGPYDLVYERYSLWSFAAMEWAAACGAPSILEVNAPLIREQATHRELVDRSGAESVAQRAFGAASVLAAVSREVARYVDGFEGARGRVHVVPNAIDPRRFARGSLAALPDPDRFTVGFLGTLKPWHGLGILVEAFAKLAARHPRCRLLVVGDGPERAALLDDANRRGLGDLLQMTGSVPPEDVPQYLASMDVSTAPYPAVDDFYFSPLKIFESMAAGVPVVASRIGQVVHLIEHGVTGLLTPPGDADALANALYRLLHDARERGAIGAAARASVLASHTWDRVAARLLELAGIAPVPGAAAAGDAADDREESIA